MTNPNENETPRRFIDRVFVNGFGTIQIVTIALTAARIAASVYYIEAAMILLAPTGTAYGVWFARRNDTN